MSLRQIERLLREGLKPAELVRMGYPKSSVYYVWKRIRKTEEQKRMVMRARAYTALALLAENLPNNVLEELANKLEQLAEILATHNVRDALITLNNKTIAIVLKLD